MVNRQFKPGFRFLAIDLFVLCAGGVASVYAMTADQWIGLAIAFVVLHFFLFCNVLRMSRPLELVWAGIFTTLAIATVSFDLLSWPTTFTITSVVTVALAVIESRRQSYHGLGWQKLNPRLPEWWQSREKQG